MQLTLRLLAGDGYEPLLDHQLTKIIEIEQNSLIRSLDVISRPKACHSVQNAHRYLVIYLTLLRNCYAAC